MPSFMRFVQPRVVVALKFVKFGTEEQFGVVA
jgi:hypothetical protein